MKPFAWLFLLATLALTAGCGSEPAPPANTAETQQAIAAEDAAVQEAESQQSGAPAQQPQQ